MFAASMDDKMYKTIDLSTNAQRREEIKTTLDGKGPILDNNGRIDFDVVRECFNYMSSKKVHEKHDIQLLHALVKDQAFSGRHKTAEDYEKDVHDVFVEGDHAKEFRKRHVPISTKDTIKDLSRNICANGIHQISLQTGRNGKLNCGRLFAKEYNQFSYLCHDVRDVIFKDYIEIDAKSCHLRIFQQAGRLLLKRESSAINKLLAERDKVYEEIRVFYGFESMYLVKKLVIVVGYLGNLPWFLKKLSKVQESSRENLVNGKEHELLQQYAKEMKKIAEKVLELHADTIVKEVGGDGDGGLPLLRKVLAYYAQTIETCQTVLAVKYCIENKLVPKENGSHLVSFLHDGFYTIVSNAQMNDHLSKIADYIKREIGLHTVWDVKKPDPKLTEEESNVLCKAPKSLDYPKMWKIAEQCFSFPNGTTWVDQTLETNNGYSVRMVQFGLDCLMVEIGRNGLWFQRKFLYETDTINGPQELKIRESLGNRTAEKAFGHRNFIRIHRHKEDEYITVPEDIGKELSCVFSPNQEDRRQILLAMKACMGSGKSYFVMENILKKVAKSSKSILSTVPRVNLVDEMVRVSNERHGIPLTGYSQKRKQRKLSSSKSTTAVYSDDEYRPSDIRNHYGKRLGGSRNERLLATTVDSLITTKHNRYDCVFLDEITKTHVQFISSTLASRNQLFVEDTLGTFKRHIANANLVIATDADLDHGTMDWIRKYMKGCKEFCVYYQNSCFRTFLRYASTKDQLLSQILRSIFVEKKNTVVACSGNNGPETIQEYIHDYVFGKHDLFGNEREVSYKEVLNELMLIHHDWSLEETVEFVGKVMNGCLLLNGDDHTTMKSRKKRVFRDGICENHIIQEQWYWDSQKDIWSTTKCDNLEHSVVLFAYSPTITIGNSFMTAYFKMMFAFFPNIAEGLLCTSLLQMLKRFRLIDLVVMFLGGFGGKVETFAVQHKRAIDRTKAHNDRIINLDEALKEIHEYKTQMLQDQSKNPKGPFNKAVYASNPYNIIKKQPTIQTKASTRKKTKVNGTDCVASDEDIINAIDLVKRLNEETTIQEKRQWIEKQNVNGSKMYLNLDWFTDRAWIWSQIKSQRFQFSKEEEDRFWYITSLFSDCKVPAFSEEQLLQILRYKKEIKFLRMMEKDKFIWVSNHVGDNLEKTATINHDLKSLKEILEKYFGFETFEAYLEWCVDRPKTRRNGCIFPKQPIDLNALFNRANELYPERKCKFGNRPSHKFFTSLCTKMIQILKAHAYQLILILPKKENKKRLQARDFVQIQIPKDYRPPFPWFNVELFRFLKSILAGDTNATYQEDDSKNQPSPSKEQATESTAPSAMTNECSITTILDFDKFL